MRTRRGIRVRPRIGGILLVALIAPPAIAQAAPQSSVPRVQSSIVRLESPASRIGPGTAAVTRVRLGESVRVIMYGYFTNLSPGTTAGIGLTVSGANRAYFVSRGTMNATNYGGTRPGWRWFWNVVRPCTSPPGPNVPPNCLPQTPGRYALSAYIGLAGTQYARSTSFLVVSG